MSTAIRHAREAILLSNPLKTDSIKLLVLPHLAYLEVQWDSLVNAGANIDSAMFYEQRTDNRMVKGYAWFRKDGWNIF